MADLLDSLNILKVEGQGIVDGDSFPLIIGNDKCQTLEDTCQWLSSQAPVIDNLLQKYGVAMLRNFPVHSANDFNSIIECFPYPNFDYVGGNAVRRQLAPRVFTANESPSSEPIPFHHELAQSPSYPLHLFFFCQEAALKGGETSLLSSWDFVEKLVQKCPEFVQQVQEKGVRYVRVLSEEDDPSSAIGRGWKSTYWTEDKAQVETKLSDAGYTWEWMDNGTLKTISPILTGVKVDERTRKRVFFNQMVAAYTGWKDSRNDPRKAIVFGDFTAVPSKAMDIAAGLMEEMAVNVKWQNGDIMIVDNTLVMHARRPYEGPRRVLASLAH